MFPDIGFPEFVMILICAVLILKPDDWPRFLRGIGRTYAKIHRFLLEARYQVHSTLSEVSRLDTEKDSRQQQTAWQNRETEDEDDAFVRPGPVEPPAGAETGPEEQNDSQTQAEQEP